MTTPTCTRYAETGKIPEINYLCGNEARYITRLNVEIAYLYTILSKKGISCDIPKFDLVSKESRSVIFKDILKEEEKTKHDVKAIELYLRSHVPDAIKNLVHCGLTSQDINSVATTIMLKNVGAVFKETIETFMKNMQIFELSIVGHPFMSYTHGQPAVSVFLSREIFKARQTIENNLKHFDQSLNELTSKFSGSIGNCTTQSIIFTVEEYDDLKHKMNAALGTNIIFNDDARQIDDYSSYARMFSIMAIISRNISEFADNLWLRITRKELTQKTVAGEFGSSVMSHKINPFRLEQSRAIDIIINSLISAVTEIIMKSRDSRDMSDSYGLGYIPEIFSLFEVMTNNISIDMSRLIPNTETISRIFDENIGSLSEYIQTYLRYHYTEEIEDPYKLLEKLTKGKIITYEILHEFIDGLPINDEDKILLKNLKVDDPAGLF